MLIHSLGTYIYTLPNDGVSPRTQVSILTDAHLKLKV